MTRQKHTPGRAAGCAGSRRSSRRDAILRVVSARHGHLSAEQVFAAARKLLPGIGIATVYRSLKSLCACGVLSEFVPSDGVTRYELAGSRSHHDHLICTVCGAFIEAVDPEIERLQELLAARHGFRIASHRLEIYGTCSGCVKSRK